MATAGGMIRPGERPSTRRFSRLVVACLCRHVRRVVSIKVSNRHRLGGLGAQGVFVIDLKLLYARKPVLLHTCMSLASVCPWSTILISTSVHLNSSYVVRSRHFSLFITRGFRTVTQPRTLSVRHDRDSTPPEHPSPGTETSVMHTCPP